MGSLIVFLLVGIVAGWLAGRIMRGGGFGLVGNMVIGIVGAFLGGLLFRAGGVYAYGIVGETIVATVGAIVLLYLIRIFKRA